MENMNPEQIFGSFMPWKLDESTWILNFMNGSQNVYLLEGKERALLIDTGWGAASLAETVKCLTDKPVVAANTHYHPDHAAGNGYFTQVYVSRNWKDDAPGMDGSAMLPFDLQKMPHPDYEKIEVGEGDTIDLGDRMIEVLEVKNAHCNSSLFFLDRDHRMIFVGDEMEAAQVNLFDNSYNPELKYDVDERLRNFQANTVRLKELSPFYTYLLPNHNGFPIAVEYLDDYIELVDEIYLGKAEIEDKLNHPFIEMDPQAKYLCRVRHKNASIFIRKDELLKVYGTQI